MKDTVFLTTIYPMEESYIIDFFNSLSNQTESQFDVLVVNDDQVTLEKFIVRYPRLSIIPIVSGGSIAKNRELLIGRAIDMGYKFAIFGDMDDYFDLNRVEVAKELLLVRDIVVNDLTTFVDKTIVSEKLLSTRVQPMTKVELEFVLDKNVFGLSNTAIRLDAVSKKDVVFNAQLVAVDWYFFTCLLLAGKTAVFTDKTNTHYRQYAHNTVGMGVIDERSILKAISVKRLHYSEMIKKNEIFRPNLVATEKLFECVQVESQLKELVRINRANLDSPLWWEVIER